MRVLPTVTILSLRCPEGHPAPEFVFSSPGGRHTAAAVASARCLAKLASKLRAGRSALRALCGMEKYARHRIP